MPVDNDSRLSREPSGADPMAEHKRRARWRLIGAVLIAGSVAAIAPYVLEEQARPLADDLLIDLPVRSSDSRAPAADTPSPSPSAASVAVAPPAGLTPSAPLEFKPDPAPSSKTASVPAPPAASTPTSPPAAPAAEPSATDATTTTSAAEKIFVQVGAYARLEAAKTVQARMLLGGHKVTLETIKTADGSERHRVRIGPFETRESATQVRDRARSQGYEAILVAQ